MPNNTSTQLTVKGDFDQIQELIKLVAGEENGEKVSFCCNSIIPMPPELNITSTTISEKNPDPERLKLKEKQEANLKKYGFKDWYDWCIANWGSKWGTYDATNWEIEVGTSADPRPTAKISWLSAWSPISPVIKKLSEKFPELVFDLYFVDEGWMYSGVETYYDGYLQDDQDIECSESNPIFIDLCHKVGYPLNSDIEQAATN